MPFLLTLYKNILKKLLNFLWIDIKEDEYKLHNFNKYHLLLAYQKYLFLSYSSPVVEVRRLPLWAKGLCWLCNDPCCRYRQSLPVFPPNLTSNCWHHLLAWGHLWWQEPSLPTETAARSTGELNDSSQPPLASSLTHQTGHSEVYSPLTPGPAHWGSVPAPTGATSWAAHPHSQSPFFTLLPVFLGSLPK